MFNIFCALQLKLEQDVLSPRAFTSDWNLLLLRRIAFVRHNTGLLFHSLIFRKHLIPSDFWGESPEKKHYYSTIPTVGWRSTYSAAIITTYIHPIIQWQKASQGCLYFAPRKLSAKKVDSRERVVVDLGRKMPAMKKSARNFFHGSVRDRQTLLVSFSSRGSRRGLT